MEELFNKNLKEKGKDEKVYVVNIQCYNITKGFPGSFLFDDISVYRTEQDAKDAVKRKIICYKNDGSYTNVNVVDWVEGMKFITYSFSDDPSESFKLRIIIDEYKVK